MTEIFIDQVWLDSLVKHLNTDEKYGSVASNWEGDIVINILPSGDLKEGLIAYLELWHGKCPSGRFLESVDEVDAKFVLTTEWDNILKILKGEMDVMQAMMTRKLGVKGNMPYIVRNVPTVLDFVRCAQDVTKAHLAN